MIIDRISIADAWEESIFRLLNEGVWIPSERGCRAKEMRNLLFSISSPGTQPQVSNKYAFPQSFIQEYSDNYLISMKSTNSVAERINRYGENSLNQSERIIQILTNHYYSRRAVINTWQQNVDLFSNHPPCITSLQFQVRNNSLEVTSVLRSNDAWFAALPDLISIYKIQKKIADALNIGIGCLNMLSVNYHIYEMDFLKAKGVFI
ncbi:MAG: hypothetical protein JXB49_05480 [Bacteroidales bacterium]|nr:hypothetical protein [Bacteroidales bacterium]